MALTKVTNDLLALGESTSSLNLAKGTTAQRPSSPVAGMVRENTDDNVIEYYNGTEWKQVLAPPEPMLVDYLVVAGGGGSGGGTAGGGGAGGLRTSYGSTSGGGIPSETPLELTLSTQYVITIGAGGIGATNDGGNGTSGANSSFDTITSIGGGGGQHADVGLSGGSAGGNGYVSTDPNTVGQGTSGQGFDGGAGQSAPYYTCGGGGGASQDGGDAINYVGGTGGNGLQVSITGTPTYYAGGGAGGTNSGTVSGGLGGGGDSVDEQNGQAGEVNTGGGGGGPGTNSVLDGGNGGSGVVILRLLTSQYSGTTTGSPTVTTDGSHTVLTYTSSGTYTA